MSAQAVQRVLDHPLPKQHTARLILMVLAYHSHPKHDCCWMSQENIAAEVGISDRGLRRWLLALQSSGNLLKGYEKQGKTVRWRVVAGRECPPLKPMPAGVIDLLRR